MNHHACSFKVKTKLPGSTRMANFCRNEHNVTGQCNRSSCPLANSRYATVLERNGRCYLYMKTAERAHTPKDLWQKVRLSKEYDQALAQVDEHLVHWPKFLVHKNKQRLTKITQMLIRMRRLAVRAAPKVVPLAARTEKRELRREAKALAAAKVERAIEQELLGRLQKGEYGDIYNFPLKQYQKVLDENEAEEEREGEMEGEEGGDGLDAVDRALLLEAEEEDRRDIEENGDRFVAFDEDDDSGSSSSGEGEAGGDSDSEGGGAPRRKRAGGRRGRRGPVELELEEERELTAR